MRPFPRPPLWRRKSAPAKIFFRRFFFPFGSLTCPTPPLPLVFLATPAPLAGPTQASGPISLFLFLVVVPFPDFFFFVTGKACFFSLSPLKWPELSFPSFFPPLLVTCGDAGLVPGAPALSAVGRPKGCRASFFCSCESKGLFVRLFDYSRFPPLVTLFLERAMTFVFVPRAGQVTSGLHHHPGLIAFQIDYLFSSGTKASLPFFFILARTGGEETAFSPFLSCFPPNL